MSWAGDVTGGGGSFSLASGWGFVVGGEIDCEAILGVEMIDVRTEISYIE
jgi:hypothetical protein